MPSAAYLDTVGNMTPGPAAYGHAIQRPCPRCGAAEYKLCVNPKTGSVAKVPCVARINSAYAAASSRAS
jgi:hypothetical protein